MVGCKGPIPLEGPRHEGMRTFAGTLGGVSRGTGRDLRARGRVGVTLTGLSVGTTRSD